MTAGSAGSVCSFDSGSPRQPPRVWAELISSPAAKQWLVELLIYSGYRSDPHRGPPARRLSCSCATHLFFFFSGIFFSLCILPLVSSIKLMETLLAHSFDYLSSYEPSKVRKGLRQVEGLLAQICLSKSKQSAADRRRSMLSFGAPQPVPKALTDLKDDPAFREFFKLQEGFQWNGRRASFYACLRIGTVF